MISSSLAILFHLIFKQSFLSCQAISRSYTIKKAGRPQRATRLHVVTATLLTLPQVLPEPQGPPEPHQELPVLHQELPVLRQGLPGSPGSPVLPVLPVPGPEPPSEPVSALLPSCSQRLQKRTTPTEAGKE
jgi:hypothetical protein